MGYSNLRKVGGDYFRIQKKTKSNNSLDFYTNQFNPDDYYIYKATNKFKEVSTKEFLDFKYAKYIFFKKELYDKNWIDLWIDWTTTNSNIKFLDNPFPPFNPQKIKIYQRWELKTEGG